MRVHPALADQARGNLFRPLGHDLSPFSYLLAIRSLLKNRPRLTPCCKSVSNTVLKLNVNYSQEINEVKNCQTRALALNSNMATKTVRGVALENSQGPRIPWGP